MSPATTTEDRPMTDRPTGPASYFPSIEQKHGRPIAHWTDAVAASGLRGHGAIVTWLKTEHGFGHGHAAALASHVLAAGDPRPDDAALVDRLFPARKAHWRPLYDEIVALCTTFGDVVVRPKKTLVGLGTPTQFAMLQPSTPGRFDVGLKLPGTEPTARLEVAGAWNTMMTHRVRLGTGDRVDPDLAAWLRAAHATTRRAA